MFKFSIARMIVVLLYFTLCSACGKPASQPQPTPDGENGTTSRADDINYVGGGTQAPEPLQKEEEYRSPTISREPAPTNLRWAPSIGAAVRITEDGNNNYKIIVWFTGSGCVDCTAIEQDIFKDADVLANSRRWIFVRVNVDDDPEQSEYYLKEADPPAFVFLDQRGLEYRQHIGIVTKEEFVSMLMTWW
jgi:thiol:disulfide interchange protein